MEPINIEIYKGFKQIGMLPGKFIDKTELREKHILLSNKYDIKPGYILIADKREKFYVIDVRLHRTHRTNRKLEIYYETEATHRQRVAAERKVNFSLFIAFAALIVSTIALFKK